MFINGEGLEDKLKEIYLSSLFVGKNSNHLRINAADVIYRHNGVITEKQILSNWKYFPEEALKHAYISANTKYNLSWLIFDIDTHFNLSDLDDFNLPLPNIYISTTEKGTHPDGAQLWYLLDNPVWLQEQFNKKEKGVTSYQYAKAIYIAMNKKLNGDPNFSRGLSKNPWYKCEEWETFFIHDDTFKLSDLAAHLDLETPIENKGAENEADYIQGELFNLPEYNGVILEGERNTRLFDETRKQAYLYYKENNCNESQLYNFCFQVAEDLNRSCRNMNNLLSPLKNTEIKSIARSISKWTYGKNFSNSLFHKYSDQQRAYALEVRKRNRNINKNKLRIFLKRNEGKKLSNREISRIFSEDNKKGFSLDTVNKFMHELKEEKKLLENAKENKEIIQKNKVQSDFYNTSQNITSERFLSVCSPMGLDLNLKKLDAGGNISSGVS